MTETGVRTEKSFFDCFFRLQGASGPLLFAGYSRSGIFINAVDQAGDHADCKKQPQSPVPGKLLVICHILEKGDDHIGDASHIGRGLGNLPDRRLKGCHGVGPQAQVEQQVECRGNIKRNFSLKISHMNSLDTLYFPGTDINSVRQYPIFLLFQRVHLLIPVEGDPVEGGVESPDSFIKSGFCQVHTPCPLGRDRNRFLHLVEEIKTRKDDYAGQLSSLTLAAMSGGPARAEEESERSIVRSLLPTGEPAAQRQDLDNLEILWQARLVLAIGELLDNEEEEIALNLAQLEDEEKKLFMQLQGEDDRDDEENPFAELTVLKDKLRGSHVGNISNRFKAWKTLFLAATMAECPIFLTTSPDGGDLMLESFEKRTGRPAPLVARLELPAFVGWNSAEAGQTVRDFTADNGALLARLEEKLVAFLGMVATPESLAAEVSAFTSLNEAWHQLLAADFPEERFGRIQVRIFLFPGFPGAALLGKTPETAKQHSNGLLAVVG